MQTGLVSVTFRELPISEIIRLAREAGLDGIEWGSDYHCKPGDTVRAKEIAGLMKENNLSVISYGSYYKSGDETDFSSTINNALIFGTNNIRIWAGDKSSADVSEDEWRKMVADTQRVADIAREHNIDISFEYHNNTLTDSISSTIKLLDEINRDNVYSYWQALVDSEPENNVREIQKLVDHRKLKNLHVQATGKNGRVALTDMQDIWKSYISAASPANPALLIEFVKDDSIEQFLDDAKILIDLKG